MSCKHYKKELIEAAAGNTWPSGAVREHVESCHHCQEFLAREQTLFASIETTLRRHANPELPPFFLKRASERLSRVPEPTAYRRPAFAFATVLLVVTLAVATHYRRGAVNRDLKPEHNPEITLENASSRTMPDKRLASDHRSSLTPRMSAERHRFVRQVASDSGAPEVFVPPEERQAFARFVADSQADQSFLMAFLTGPTELIVWDKYPSVQVQPLEVKRLEVTALDPQVEIGNDAGNSR
jgi:hypothetical protein